MRVTAFSRVLEDAFVVVFERHDGVFSDANWSLEKIYGKWNGYFFYTNCLLDDGDFIDLFPGVSSGVGVLREDGSVLEISIKNPPEGFRLTTNGFDTDYYSGVSERFNRSAIVSVPSFKWSTNWSGSYDPNPMSGLLLLREDDSWGLSEKVLGKLLNDDGHVIAFVPGIPFEVLESVEGRSMGGNCEYMYGYPRYDRGGYFFGQALWVSSIVNGSATLEVNVSDRLLSFDVVISSDGISPVYTDDRYNVDWDNIRCLDNKFVSKFYSTPSTSRYLD